MKPSDIRKLSADQISEEVSNRKKELMQLRFQNVVGQLANPARVRQLKREVARLLTIKAQQSK